MMAFLLTLLLTRVSHVHIYYGRQTILSLLLMALILQSVLLLVKGWIDKRTHSLTCDACEKVLVSKLRTKVSNNIRSAHVGIESVISSDLN
jgi:hypothetical protein